MNIVGTPNPCTVTQNRYSVTQTAGKTKTLRDIFIASDENVDIV
jgi:hypothetical protein